MSLSNAFIIVNIDCTFLLPTLEQTQCNLLLQLLKVELTSYFLNFKACFDQFQCPLMSVKHLALMVLLWLALPILVLLHLCDHLSPFFPCPLLETRVLHGSVHASLLFAVCSLYLGDVSQPRSMDSSY